MSSKVVEADAGIHSLAMAVAVRFIPPLPSHVLIFCVCAFIQPVTSWRLYGMIFPLLSRPRLFCSSSHASRRLTDLWNSTDSIYTERYMNLPALNPGGYINASISNVTAFDKVDYLLAHGSGDDNVHFANSAHLLDMFTQEHIRNYRFRMFTDRYVCCTKGLWERKKAEMNGRPQPVITVSRSVGQTENCMST